MDDNAEDIESQINVPEDSIYYQYLDYVCFVPGVGAYIPFITTRDQLPQNDRYRDSWVENGVQVTEDLAKSKEIALADVRVVADESTGYIQRAFLLNEDPGVTQDDLTNAYEQAKTDIENATEVPTVLTRHTSFLNVYRIVED